MAATRATKFALLGCVALLLACGAGLLLATRPLLAFDYQWCSNTFFTYSNIKLSRFRPLP